VKSSKISFPTLSAFALALVAISATGQSPVGDRIYYPPEFSPLVTGRPLKAQRSLIPPAKFVKVLVPNRYIVVLNDDVVQSDAPLDVRRARVSEIASLHSHRGFSPVDQSELLSFRNRCNG